MEEWEMGIGNIISCVQHVSRVSVQQSCSLFLLTDFTRIGIDSHESSRLQRGMHNRAPHAYNLLATVSYCRVRLRQQWVSRSRKNRHTEPTVLDMAHCYHSHYGLL